MTAIILPFHAEMDLPPMALPGNPERVTMQSDFPGDTERIDWAELVAGAVAASHGQLSSQAVRRLSASSANVIENTEPGAAGVLLRCVTAVRRPSGRIASVILAHVLLRAVRFTSPEGTYVELRAAAPVVYTGGATARDEVVEATLEQLLDQVEAACQSLSATLGKQPDDCMVWSLPSRTQASTWFTELNRRLVQRFYAPLQPQKWALVA